MTERKEPQLANGPAFINKTPMKTIDLLSCRLLKRQNYDVGVSAPAIRCVIGSVRRTHKKN